MEYLISKVLLTMATIMVAVGEDRDGSYESNQLGSSDLTYNGHGPQQGYQGSGHGYVQGSGHGYDQGGHGYEKGGAGKDYYAEPHYAFAYEVHDDHTGDIKSHKEERKGDHTQGMYMLVEPNGSKRIVEYVVQGKSGFSAKVHQSKPQEPHGGHTAGQSGHTGFTGGYPTYAGYTTGHPIQSGYTGGHSGNTGFAGGYSSHTGEHLVQSSHTGGPHASLGEYATGYYTSHNQSPYKVQENTPTYNHKPSTYKPTFNLQPFKPLIPYIPTDPQHSKNHYNSNPLVALYRPQTSYKPLPLNRPVSYKFTPSRQSIPDSHSNHGHATSSVSFSSHGSKIATTTNHVAPQQRYYENKH